jgi:hypothetical protein
MGNKITRAKGTSTCLGLAKQISQGKCSVPGGSICEC